MNKTLATVVSNDPIWDSIRQAAAAMAADEPILGSLAHVSVLNQSCFEDALNSILAQELASAEAPAMLLRQVFDSLVADDAQIGIAARADLTAVCERDPACKSPMEALLFFKGFHLPCRRIGWRMLCNNRVAAPWRSICRAGRR